MDNEIVKKENTNYVEKYSILNSIKLFKKVDCPLKAYQSKTESLAQINKDMGENTTLAFIKMWLINLNEYINANRKLKPVQIEEISMYILNDYYYLKISDLYLCFTNIKKGKYGSLYESIDGVKILSYFEEYSNDRMSAISNNNTFNDMKHKECNFYRSGKMKQISDYLDSKK